MTTPDWMIGLFLLAMALALAAICFRLGKAWADEALEESRDYWLGACEDEEGKLREERAAHEATTLRCSEAEARLAQISLLAAPRS